MIKFVKTLFILPIFLSHLPLSDTARAQTALEPIQPWLGDYAGTCQETDISGRVLRMFSTTLKISDRNPTSVHWIEFGDFDGNGENLIEKSLHYNGVETSWMMQTGHNRFIVTQLTNHRLSQSYRAQSSDESQTQRTQYRLKESGIHFEQIFYHWPNVAHHSSAVVKAIVACDYVRN